MVKVGRCLCINFCKNLDGPKPYTVIALKTKDDRRDDDAWIKKKS